MIIQRKDMRLEKKDNMRGGEGTCSLVHIVEPASMKNARLMVEFTMPPGASIGEHDHQTETEYYIILSGTATVIDEGTAKQVGPGDVVVTGNGAKHSIKNTGSAPLVFHAVIITY